MKLTSLLVCLLAFANANDNGLALLPPMGWRSWNQFGSDISQDLFENNIMPGLTDKSRMVDGKPTSLLELGYNRMGMDDGWQACYTGINKTFHDKDGNPLINKTLFPDIKSMNDKAHDAGLLSGWYLNNCICQESGGKIAVNKTVPNDVQALVELGFDSVKIDSCGPNHDVGYFAQLMNDSGRPILIEDCNDEGTTYQQCNGHFFRSGADIFGYWAAIINRVQAVASKFGFTSDPNEAVSRPGCWAYPDMLQVGTTRTGGSGRNFTDSRSHFGMWCIVSSPLILGMDFSEKDLVDLVWPIISNKEAIAINQDFVAPHAGKMVKELKPGKTIHEKKPYDISWQVWAKNLTGGKIATLLLNAEDFAQDVSVTLEELGITSGKASARDVWKKKDVDDVSGSITAKMLAPHDSIFLVLEEKK